MSQANKAQQMDQQPPTRSVPTLNAGGNTGYAPTPAPAATQTPAVASPPPTLAAPVSDTPIQPGPPQARPAPDADAQRRIIDHVAGQGGMDAGPTPDGRQPRVGFRPYGPPSADAALPAQPGQPQGPSAVGSGPTPGTPPVNPNPDAARQAQQAQMASLGPATPPSPGPGAPPSEIGAAPQVSGDADRQRLLASKKPWAPSPVY